MCLIDNILDTYLLSNIATGKFSITCLAGIIFLFDNTRSESGSIFQNNFFPK